MRLNYDDLNLLTSLGLLLDLVGVVMVFKYGLPSVVTIEKDEDVMVTENYDNIKYHQDLRRIERLSKIGLSLVVLGFILQFLGSIFHLTI